MTAPAAELLADNASNLLGVALGQGHDLDHPSAGHIRLVKPREQISNRGQIVGVGGNDQRVGGSAGGNGGTRRRRARRPRPVSKKTLERLGQLLGLSKLNRQHRDALVGGRNLLIDGRNQLADLIVLLH